MIQIKDFILEYPNFITPEHCKYIISYYDNAEKAGFTVERIKQRTPRIDIDDKQLFSDTILDATDESVRVDGLRVLDGFQDAFWKSVFEPYVDEYTLLAVFKGLKIRHIKIQKTRIGGGYHAWHCENLETRNAGRVLTFVLYLNDVHEGGETEFLYYPKRVKAEAGKLVLFPGSFTHTHRGNPPISNEKYILTGWVETE